MLPERRERFTGTKISRNIYLSWINITIFGHNLEATCVFRNEHQLFQYKGSQAHPRGNTLPNYQSLTQPLSICKFSWTIFYPWLCVVGRHILLRVAGGINTIHPQATYLPKDNSLLEELSSVESLLMERSQSFEFWFC